MALADCSRKAVSDDEEIYEVHDTYEPGTAWIPGDEPLAEVNDASEPEDLAGDKDHEQGQEAEQVVTVAA
jgi:hypothetical protein